MQLGVYQHYKGKKYEVVGVAKHSETLEDLVVYKALYVSGVLPYGQLWVRPLTMFKETVIVDGAVMPRFKYLNEYHAAE